MGRYIMTAVQLLLVVLLQRYHQRGLMVHCGASLIRLQGACLGSLGFGSYSYRAPLRL